MKPTAAMGWSALLVVGCGSTIMPLAVGSSLGGESFLGGPSHCRYEAPPSVAQLSDDHTSGKIVGEGKLSQSCGAKVTEVPTRRVTEVRIEGPDAISLASQGRMTLYKVVPLNDGITLGGNFTPLWTLGDDCKGVADFAPVMGSQDTGGQDTSRSLVPQAAGTCTLHVTALGLSARHSVKIR